MAEEVNGMKEGLETNQQEPVNDTNGEKDGGGVKRQEEKPLSFDELLQSNKEYQAEFDRRVNKATSTAVNNAKEKWELIADERVSEAEKLARMTSAERDRYKMQKREKDLAAREKEITRKELQATAKVALAEKELPTELSELLNYTDARACNESIDAVERAFQSAVAKAVNDRLKGAEPMKKAPEETIDEEAAMREQVRKAISDGLR